MLWPKYDKKCKICINIKNTYQTALKTLYAYYVAAWFHRSLHYFRWAYIPYFSLKNFLTSFCFLKSSKSNKTVSKSSPFIVLSALNAYWGTALSGCSQKPSGLESRYTVRLRSLPNKFKSFTNSSISSSSTMILSQCYWVNTCLIFR